MAKIDQVTEVVYGIPVEVKKDENGGLSGKQTMQNRYQTLCGVTGHPAT